MPHYIDWDSFAATFVQGFWCWLGVFVAAAYFSTVPVCQAVCGEKRFGSKHNGELDAIVCFQLIWQCLLHWQRFTKTVWMSYLLSLLQADPRDQPGHRLQRHVKMLVDWTVFINNAAACFCLPSLHTQWKEKRLLVSWSSSQSLSPTLFWQKLRCRAKCKPGYWLASDLNHTLHCISQIEMCVYIFFFLLCTTAFRASEV